MSAIEWIGASQVKRSRCAGEYRFGLGRQLRILDPGLCECLDDAAVERRVGGVVDDRAGVQALEVDRVDGARARRSSAISASSQELVGSSLKRSPG